MNDFPPSIRESLTQERLREVISYDAETGVFVWAKRPHVRYEKEAGYVYKSNGSNPENPIFYRRICVDGCAYLAHRLAFLYMTGHFPAGVVDHINNDGTDNRWINLREASPSQNQWNRRLSRNNSSGVTGVYFDRSRNNWRSFIYINNKCRELGRYPSKDTAIKARIHAETLHFGEFSKHVH
jgi:hypothetical protein